MKRHNNFTSIYVLANIVAFAAVAVSIISTSGDDYEIEEFSTTEVVEIAPPEAGAPTNTVGGTTR